MKKVEGWDCGNGRHLHTDEREAQRCSDAREERRKDRERRHKLLEAGWLIAATSTCFLAVNMKIGKGEFRSFEIGTTFGQQKLIEEEFLTNLERAQP